MYPCKLRDAGHSLDGVCSFLNDIQHLVELGSKEIESGEDSTVRAEVIPAKRTTSRSVTTMKEVR